MTTATRPSGSEIQATLGKIIGENASLPLADTLAAVAEYFTENVFTPEETKPAQRVIEQLIAEKIVSSILPVGAKVDDFTLPDSDGHEVTLSEVLKSGLAVIVFYRGAWCPYCNLHLMRFQQHIEQFRTLGATLIAISPQSPDPSATVQRSNGLGFPVLSDLGSHVARQFGVAYTEPAEMARLHEEFGVHLRDFNGGENETLPIPATFIIDRDGRIQWVSADFDYTHRSEPSEVLATVQKLVS
jgi:peroxiredoxin